MSDLRGTVRRPSSKGADMSVEPCQTCGSPVRERRVKGQKTLGDESGQTDVIRACTNPDCPTNNSREQGLGDAV